MHNSPLEQFTLLAKSARGAAAVELIKQALEVLPIYPVIRFKRWNKTDVFIYSASRLLVSLSLGSFWTVRTFRYFLLCLLWGQFYSRNIQEYFYRHWRIRSTAPTWTCWIFLLLALSLLCSRILKVCLRYFSQAKNCKSKAQSYKSGFWGNGEETATINGILFYIL